MVPFVFNGKYHTQFCYVGISSQLAPNKYPGTWFCSAENVIRRNNGLERYESTQSWRSMVTDAQTGRVHDKSIALATDSNEL